MNKAGTIKDTGFLEQVPVSQRLYSMKLYCRFSAGFMNDYTKIYSFSFNKVHSKERMAILIYSVT